MCRPEDFVVHEINDDNIEAELRDTSIPPPPIMEERSSESIPMESEGILTYCVITV